MKIDLTCPIEMRSYELTSDERGFTRARVRLNNLAAHPVSRFDAVVCWACSASGQSEARSFRAEYMNIDARSEFTYSLASVEVPEADILELHFTRVRFADGAADWIGGQSETLEINELPDMDEDELALLTDAAGDDAVRFPEATEKHWFCVCGRANAIHHRRCARCGREQNDVFRYFSREFLLSDGLPSVLPPEDEPIALSESQRFILWEKLQQFRIQRDILLRRTITMSIVIAMLMGFSAISDYMNRVEDANRGAIPPTLSAHAEKP